MANLHFMTLDHLNTLIKQLTTTFCAPFAVKDQKGNDISATYAKKSDMTAQVNTVTQNINSVKNSSATKTELNNLSAEINATASYTNRLQRNKAYKVGDIAYSPNLPSWAYLECITAGTTGATEPDFSKVSTTGGQ